MFPAHAGDDPTDEPGSTHTEAYPWIGLGAGERFPRGRGGSTAWRRPTEAIRPPEKAQDRRSEAEACLGYP